MNPSSLPVQNLFEHALRYHQAGQLAGAEQLYRQALALDPHHADSLNLLGVLMHRLGRHDEAAGLLGQAIAVRGDIPFFHNNFANALKDMGRLGEAVEHYQQAIALKPDFLEAAENLGNVYFMQGYMEKAELCYRHVLGAAADKIEVVNNLGCVLMNLTKFDEATACFERVLALQPQDTDALNNMASALKSRGLLDEAIVYYRRSIALKPDPEVYSNLLLAMIYASSVSPEQLTATAKEFGERIAAPLLRSQPMARDKNPERRLRIGYVSPDFRDHAVNYFFEPLLTKHDREQFEVFGYSNAIVEDGVTARLKQKFDHWRPIHVLNDDETTDLIEADRIDILVDLAGHTTRNRLLVFGRKPAPIQVTWLGYSATTGVKAIDYRITDFYAEPEGMTDHLNIEKLWRLPGMLSCYQAHENSPAVIDHPPFEDNEHITFGCFNFVRVTDPALKTWAEIMEKTPDSHLLLEIAGLEQPKFRNEVEARLKRLGLPLDRVILEPRKRSNQFVLYNKIDIALDPFPCNGGTTSMDTLWMGVPFITLAGKYFLSRLGVTVLSNAGLQELIAHDTDQYVELAADLANDRERLRAIRHHLREKVEKSRLMDQEKFARNMEAAYREMWRKCCRES